ncbi:lytic murein transglycosylase [Bradyrhizobium sp. U87765 SZCCT0131]|uniref:lytic murein transglycosylase n=1 Tax=unclassified Bradyrhizobium TaxID=2631580 RepID=UPI001BAB9078|nr:MULTISPECIES: lytic murein transglycosylase [unclassified Bradyrhizobium]MBR1220325.1 lytic murein transglycosylase [Bradyrhizobium sp. U87765 SZCCT0131]MBR1263220.1 lytic murein transglycosylase [Bradyrhizobium sp. U87765 SZCCT0134]MBR1306897.1 lytic murein transglycosylase [Bradyrhizobium sp. U87765 SZCCT0110]MBR1323396.1 lytic murein transglycosylase [Bradyrhizobium sp. U87765 SZCCT0109]MBR1345851.1 lytic murein transglycosylase [Bradyrhizobium sp. U87765 SZCCT0048]
MTLIDSRQLTRRTLLRISAGAAAYALSPAGAAAPPGFDQWRDTFRAKAMARGITEATYSRVMGRIAPDMTVFAQMRNQPEFNEQTWQYINRRVSDWRIIAGKEALRKHGAVFARIERDFGVERGTLLALWGVESAYGDPLVQQNHMRPVFPSLAALAWNEPRRKAYWETELINALKIVQRGWSTPEEMRGSWAGAMGHTQWMPEVWLNVGFDYDGDGRVSPFGAPDDALGSTARYLVNRGKYHRNEHWGYEVRADGASGGGSRSYAAWTAAGVSRADGQPFPQPNASAQLWTPVPGGPSFLLGPNFYAVRSYNPSMNYALAIVHLGDRILGAGPFIQPFPGSERALTLAEVQEMQTRLTRLGFDTSGTDGRVGNDTMKAIKDFQIKTGITPADGYGGLKVLARLRQG